MAGGDDSDKQMPNDPALREAVEAIRELRKAYKHLFNRGDKQLRWSRCAKAHKLAIRAVENHQLVARVDKKTKDLHKAGNGTPDQARKILKDADGTIINLERRLARGAGFHNKQLNEFARRAPRMLKKAARKKEPELPHITKTVDLAERLREVHDLAHNVMFAPLQGKNAKHNERAYAHKQIMRRLYLVASIVSNADAGQVFNYSYASGLGAACVPDRRPKKVPAKARLLPPGIQTPNPGNP
jgi:hypothetical protein